VTTVRAVATGRDRSRFIGYPYARYRHDPLWRPPLRLAERERLSPAHNPFFDHADHALWLAWRDGTVVGRIAAFDDRLHRETHGENLAALGFFEPDDTEAAGALFGAAETWARSRGRAALRGPLNPSLNESAGLLVDGFDTPPMLLMPHNPPEYGAWIEACGYTKAKDLYAWLYALDRPIAPVVAKLAERVREKERLEVRPLRLDEFAREVERLRVVYCGAWERNWGFVAPTPREFERLARELKPIFDPRGAVCAEVNGRLVACAITVPDINQALRGTGGRLLPLGLPRLLARRWIVDQARLLLLGVLPEYRALGLYPVLLHALHAQVRPVYRRVEFSWVLEDNRDINQPAEMAGARRYKTYRLYEKALA
jgi:hypothetical protein